jgi:hypothetical protein
MAEISTATRDDDPDDAAGQYPSTVMNKYHCEITKELAGDDDDDHYGVVGSQRIEKMGTCPLPKESEYYPKNNHAHEESGTTTTKYSRITENNLVCDEENKEMAFDDDRQYPVKKVGQVVQYTPNTPKKNHEESRILCGNAKKNLVGDEESKEMALDDDRQYPAKKVGQVVQCTPNTPKKNHEESGKYSGIAEKNLVCDEESKEMDNKRKDDGEDDHSGGGDGQKDDWFDAAEEINPEDEEFDDPNDSQTQAEKTKYDKDAMEYLSTLQLATQKSVRELDASKKCKSPEVTIPLSLIIIYSR